MKTPTAILLLFTWLAATATAQQPDVAEPFVNFESGPVHPIRISADGQRLFVLNTPDNRLTVFSLEKPDAPVRVAEIPVGLEPISVTQRNEDELWVVNNLSDTVSVISLAEGRVVATLRAPDEPADVVFGGLPPHQRAFVSAAASDLVHVFDAQSRRHVGSVPIFGKDPRAMVASPKGDRIWVLVHRSGNRTCILPAELAPEPMQPTRDGLPPAPPQSAIIDLDDPRWEAVASRLPDFDLVEIDVRTLATIRNIPTVGTINFDVVYDRSSASLLVANIDSRNHVAFEPRLRGHAIDSRVTRVGLGTPAPRDFYDLNAGLDHTVLPNPAGIATALAEPTGLVVSRDGSRIFVAAQGTDRIGVLDAKGTVVARIDLGEATGATVSTKTVRGPRALALHPSAPRLYSFNRLAHTVSVIDVEKYRVVAELPIGHDPTPTAMKVGRRFLYDAKRSGNGTMSCASCHIDGDIDLLAWDLGDPGGEMTPIDRKLLVFDEGQPAEHHPMKGPLLTQSLRGLSDLKPLHWRGDRENLQAFNGAFDTLMGGARLSEADNDLFSDAFMAKIAFSPNPNLNLDRSLPAEPDDANAAEGRRVFREESVFTHTVKGEVLNCVDCHADANGSNGRILTPPEFFAAVLQPVRVATLRNLYRREGGTLQGLAKVGFGYLYDGRYDSLDSLVHAREFAGIPADKRDDLAAFLRAFDTGTAPAVGYQVQLDARTAGDATVRADLAILEGQAGVNHCDLVASGVIDGVGIGLLFDPVAGSYRSDRREPVRWTRSELEDLARTGKAALVFTGVPPGSGVRIGIDRDLDGVPNGAEETP